MQDGRGEEDATPLIAVVRQGNLDAVRRMAGKGMDVNASVRGDGTALIVAIALFDGTALAGTVWAPLLGPLLAVLGIGSIAVALFTLSGLVVFESASLRALAKAALYLTVRRWYFSVVALVMVALIATAVLLQPVLGAALVPGILLYAVFANAQYSFHRAMEAER